MGTSNQWNNSAAWYDENMGETGDKLNNKILRPAVLKILGDITNKQILDLGCGSGYFTAELAKSAQSVIGTDFSENFIKICQKKYKNYKNLTFAQHNAKTKIPFTDDVFDLVISKMVLQYVDQIDIFAKESFRVLTKSGKLVVVIDHPFHAQYYYAQQKVGKPNPKYPKLRDYFSEKPSEKISLWGKVRLTWYPRSIAEYVNIFITAGFKLLQMNELPEEENGIIIPRILILVFQKS